MTAPEPRSARQLTATGRPGPWRAARDLFGAGDTYWLATVRPDGAPHLVPVLAVVAGGRIHVAAGDGTRKAADLARDPRCVLSTNVPGADVVVEGTAVRVTDEAALRDVAAAYRDKYGWEVEVRDGAFHADGAPTAGPPPYRVYEVVPATAFSFGTDESYGATRWSF